MTVENCEITIRPNGTLQILSKQEANQLCDHSDKGLNELLRRCALAVLNTGNNIDSGEKLLEMHPEFDIKVQSRGRGIELILCSPPKSAFIDGEMIEGLREHLFAVVRDLIYVRNSIIDSGLFDLNTSKGITNAVFHILRNAEVLRTNEEPNLIACWGGHAISRYEYEYSRHVGIALGERRLNICTGCGPGVMKGPMRGAEAGHHNQRFTNRRYIGLSEPGIIAAEAPNTVVNELVVLPDIEKRLEAFVRLAHGIVIFPGGPGTLEELLYILSIMLDPKNATIPFPLVLTGDQASKAYFDEVKLFIAKTLGESVVDQLNITLNDPVRVANYMRECMHLVKEDRKKTSDAYYYNWQLHIEPSLQMPFEPTHASMRTLNLTKNQPPHLLAAQLRCAFSGIVAGNVKSEGLRAIAQHGPFEIKGDPEIMQALGRLLDFMIQQKRMKIDADTYIPSYRII